MDPDTELGLIKHSVTFFLLAVPQCTLVGIDAQDERYCQAVNSLEFDRLLCPYNLSQYGDWKHLLNYITKSIVERIEPIGGEITVAWQSGIVKKTPKTAMEKALDE